jgi:hypothetical protein
MQKKEIVVKHKNLKTSYRMLSILASFRGHWKSLACSCGDPALW